MKRLIASDLHGSLPYCRQLLDLYRQEGAEQLVLLGDLAYSGSYDPLRRAGLGGPAGLSHPRPPVRPRQSPAPGHRPGPPLRPHPCARLAVGRGSLLRQPRLRLPAPAGFPPELPGLRGRLLHLAHPGGGALPLGGPAPSPSTLIFLPTGHRSLRFVSRFLWPLG